MGNPAARLTDQVLQDAPNCHAPIHPPAPVPTPVPHPATPLVLALNGVNTVLIGKLPTATMGTRTVPCACPAACGGAPASS